MLKTRIWQSRKLGSSLLDWRRHGCRAYQRHPHKCEARSSTQSHGKRTSARRAWRDRPSIVQGCYKVVAALAIGSQCCNKGFTSQKSDTRFRTRVHDPKHLKICQEDVSCDERENICSMIYQNGIFYVTNRMTNAHFFSSASGSDLCFSSRRAAITLASALEARWSLRCDTHALQSPRPLPSAYCKGTP